MANKIKFKRGLKSKLPTLEAGEPAFLTDTRELFVGTGSGNVNMGGSQWYTGTAMSGTITTTGYYSYSACPLVKLGDIYLNTSNGNVYQCTTAGSGTTAKWTYKGCLRGVPGSSATVTVDASLSETSTNPVQNKVVKAALDNLTQIVAPLSVRDTDDTTEIDIDHIIAEQDLEVIGETYLDGDLYMEDNAKIHGRVTLYDPVTVYNDLNFDDDPVFCGFSSLCNLCAELFTFMSEAKRHGWDVSLPGE